LAKAPTAENLIKLLKELRLFSPTVGLGVHSTLGPLGRRLLGNAVAFYFLSS